MRLGEVRLGYVKFRRQFEKRILIGLPDQVRIAYVR